MNTVSKRILIFDDDDDIQSICTFILEQDGWQVSVKGSCAGLIDHITAFNPSVILMDNWIPDEGGVVATQRIKSTAGTKYIPVIYFSANSDIESLAKTAGADMFLPKPFDLNELIEIVNKAYHIKKSVS